jgi:HPt (histidine-containing phosphotransfer) domain-containing protein/HAMP domain-containing protein
VSVGTKLAAAMLFVLALATSFTYFQVNRNEREQLLAARAKAAMMVAELFAASATAPLSFGDLAGVRENVTLLLKNGNVVCGAVWAADGAHPGDIGEKLAETTRFGFLSVQPREIPGAVRVDRTADAVVVDQPVIGAAGEVLGMVRVAFSLQQENAAIAEAKRRTLVTALALGVGLGIVLLALTRTLIVRRLARLARAAKNFEDGQAIDLDVETNDEVGSLSRAFASMTEVIATREEHIFTRNRDLRRVLDNVAEGLLTVDVDGRMSEERSRVFDEWFGTANDSEDLFQYFAAFSPETARWLRIGWETLRDGFMPVEAVIDQLPKRFEHRERHFELDYRPIWRGPESDDCVSAMLIVVRDVTTRIAGERAEHAQQQALNVFRRLLADRAGFREFFAGASSLLEAITAGCAGDEPTRVARDVHTLKGNTSLYGLESIAAICHQIEHRLAEEGGAPNRGEIAQLREAWEAVRRLVEELGLGPDDDRIDLLPDEYEAHLAGLEQCIPNHALTFSARAWRYELASKRLHRIVEQGRSIARRVGKPDVSIEVQATPKRLRLPALEWSAFWPVFTHVLRNTFDHGIETTAERVAAGKSPQGNVTIHIARLRHGVEVSIRDDGRGVAWDRIRDKAQSLGLPHETRADLEEALYADSVSSRSTVSEISGRGLGMGAVRDVVRAHGGSIAIESADGRGTTLRIRFPSAMLGLDAPTTSAAAPLVA